MDIQEKKEKKTYSSNEVCEILNEKKYNIIYMEKMLGLTIAKDKLSHKVYTDKDVEILKRAKAIKSENEFSYEAIKKKLLPSTDNESNCLGKEEDPILAKEIILPDLQAPEKSNSFNDLEYFRVLMEEVINDRVDEILTIKLDALKSYIENEFEYLRKQNTDIKTKMEIDIENYASEVSIKIDSLKRSKERSKKGFFR
jgi:DNA-binding transcriptional MerR regulator